VDEVMGRFNEAWKKHPRFQASSGAPTAKTIKNKSTNSQDKFGLTIKLDA